MCNERFTRHLTEDTPQKHSCDICGRGFTQRDTLKKHVNLAHMNKETKFSCRFCDKEFDRKCNIHYRNMFYCIKHSCVVNTVAQ